MVQQKAAAFIFCSSLLISMFYYNYYDNKLLFRVDVKARIREPIYLHNGSEDFLINTTGCLIPNYGNKMKFIQTKDRKQSCGQRAIFVKRVDNDHNIIFQINTDKMKKYVNEHIKYECCYMFASRSKSSGKEDTVLSYTTCKPFENGSKAALLQEVITVTCVIPPKKRVVYKDAYIVLKKQTNNIENIKEKKKSWNVLLLGMDTMSRARVFSEMPKTVKYLKKDGWADYKGYQKVGYNTFPNLMSLLTGMNTSSIYSACKPNMYNCNDLIIWSEFRKAGYITAYGEDYLSLPDTFFRYNGFESIPTHHYMRPFFLTGENQKGNIICTSRLPSAKHMLDYAYDFANAYKNENYFGMFWINSYSHNANNLPSLFENHLLNFFERVYDAGIMNNTFIIFLSDHGIRYGPMRMSIESYYEERLPMFFVWVPNEFRESHEEEYYNLLLNQNRLVTPYDVYVTLMKISNMSVISADITSKACPKCTNIFEEISTGRTCEEVGVSERWCSCHEMKSVNSTIDKDAENSLKLAVSYVKDKVNQIETLKCMKCHSLQLQTVLRTHSFKDGNKTYYVVAFQMNPGNVVFETTTVLKDDKLSILKGVDSLTGYNTRGNCVKNPNYRMYCVCKKIKC